MKLDIGLSADNLKEISKRFLEAVKEHTRQTFPEDVYEQLEIAIKAVFNSWIGQKGG